MLHRRPLLCLVTDRRVVAGPASPSSEPEGTSFPRWHQGPLIAHVRAAVEAGIDLVQVRAPELSAVDLLKLAETCVEIARGTDTVVVVNERIDVAIAAGAHGVHLRASSPTASAVRRLVGPGFLIGRSVHRVEDMVAGADRDADYLIAGTVFPSRSKPSDHSLLGLAGLAAIVAATTVPVLAIGGVSERHVPAVASTGAAGIAAIDLFGGSAERLGDRVQQVRATFQAAGRPAMG